MRKMFLSSALIVLGVVLMSFVSEKKENKSKANYTCTITHNRYIMRQGVRELHWSRTETCDGKYVIKYLFGIGPLGRITNGDLQIPAGEDTLQMHTDEYHFNDEPIDPNILLGL